MRRYILFILLSISTGLKAQVFTEVDPAVTNFDGLAAGTIVWGDYDNDGDLDILSTGSRNYPNNDVVTRIYRNKGDGTFENSGISLPGIHRGAAAWGDYDNDGDLDIVLTGLSNTLGWITRIYRNKGDGTFENSNIPLTGTYDSAVAWGDYNNDGYLDLSVTGLNSSNIPTSWVYRNKRDGTFENSGFSLAGVRNGAQAWADYDNDGDLDIVQAGHNNLNSTPLTKIHRNKGDGTFEDSGIPLPQVAVAGIAWGDYDNDGDQDLLITGNTDNLTPGMYYVAKLYRNKGDGTFEDSGIPLPAMNYSQVAWGDYDNDGNLDMILMGYNEGAGAFINKIYRNRGDGTFEDSGSSMPYFSWASVSFGDSDNDGDLDLLIAGYSDGPKSKFFINNTITPNTKPTAPTGLQVGRSPDGKGVTLSWQKATDAQTSQNGLSYNVYISGQLSPMADITTGYRRVASMGNAGARTSYTIKGLVPGKKYSWSVQAVDAAFAGSAFATEQEFTAPAFEENVTAGLPNIMDSDVSWGDYDNDGDLDILLVGRGSGLASSYIYRNKGDGTFEDSGVPIPELHEGAAAWGDYDNDGHLDFIVTGMLSGTAYSRIFHNKGDGTFEDSGIPIQDVFRGAVAWGDYDNDGDLDLVLTGNPDPLSNIASFSRIYRNKGDGTFEDSGIPIQNVNYSAVGWADYDNDGDLDLLLTGYAGPVHFKIYRNKGDGTFENSGLNIGGAVFGSVAWGDYDNDGDLDFLISGNSGFGLIAKIYRNRGNGTFDDIGAPVTGVYAGSASWGDCDNDGDLDLLITGLESLSSLTTSGTRLYRNKGDGTFENSGMPLNNVGRSSAAWGDYNNDGRLDMLLTGTNPGITTRLYKNIYPIQPNTAPQAPTGLQVTLSADSKSATLTWQKSTDAETVQTGLHYNVYVRKASGTLQAPMANMTTGYRRIATMGNSQINTDIIKGLDLNTTYYWSVQAIDAAFTGSPFAAEQSFVTKNTQTISFTNITATYGDADFNAGASATSSLPIALSSDNANVATIVAGKIHITGTGTANITASQAGNGSFLPATDATVSITVGKKALTVAAVNKTITYGDALPTLTYNIPGLVTGDAESMFTTPVSITTDAIASSDAGSYNITAANAAAANYDFTYVPGVLTITKAPGNITFPNFSAKTYGDVDFAPGAIIGNGLPVTYLSSDANVATIVNGTIHIIGAGTTTITAQQPGNNNYLAATDVPKTLTVNKRMLTVTAAAKNIIYGDALPVLTYGITNFVPGEVESIFTTPVGITTDAIANSDAGLYDITPTGAVAANYAFTYVPAKLTIGKAASVITFNNLPGKTYGDVDFVPGATIGNNLPITYVSSNANVATIANGEIHITGAGTATITAQQAGNINYLAAADVPKTFTVNKRMLSVTAVAKTINYGDALPVLTYGITNFATGEAETVFTTPVDITTDATPTSDAGLYDIFVTGAVANNYAFTYVPAKLTISKAAGVITFNNLSSKTYGDGNFAPGATIGNGLNITYVSSNTNVATILNGEIHITGAGTATITAQQGGNNNYLAAADVPKTLTVNKRALSVTAEDKFITYGDALPLITYKITGFIPGESEAVFNTPVKVTTTANANSQAGTYPITPGNASAANYLFNYTDGAFTISKASSAISFVSLPTKTYGDGDFNPGASISNGLPITYTSTGVATIVNGLIHITGAGTATITAQQPGDNNHLRAADVSVTLTVHKKALTVTAKDQTKIYGEPKPAFTYTITGFVNGEHENVFKTPLNITSTGINGGTYPITPANATADNYTINYVAGTFTILKASQTITFITLPVKTYGDADFNPGATSNAGLQTTYNSSDPNVATIVNGNIHITGAGTATITAMQSGNGNYTAGASLSQQLIVKKARQTIRFAPMVKRTVGEGAFDPGAMASSGLPISYAIENISLATLNGNRITPTRAGFTMITASQPGDNNFEPAVAVTQELEITTGGNQLKVSDAVTPNGDGVNDYLLIEGIRQFPDNQLYISNTSGKIVFEAKGYNNTNNVFRGFAGTGTSLLSRGVYYYVLLYQGKKQSGFFVLEY